MLFRSFCFLLGSEMPFAEDKLKALYPTPAAYTSRVSAAIAAARRVGVLEAEDAAEILAAAARR